MHKGLATLALLLALAGCGGESSNGGSTGGGVTGPIGSPAPTPAATPAPAVSYAKAFNFTADREFELAGAEISTVDRPVPGGGWTFDHASGALLNARENNQARFRYSDTTMTLKVGTSETTFPGNWLQPLVPNALQWTDLQPETLKTLIITNWSLNDYVAFLRHEDETRFLDASGLKMRLTIERYLVGGSYTLPSDHPTSGTKSYLVGVSSSSPTRDGAGGFFANESLRMDFSGNTFTATLSIEQISWITGKAPLKTTMQLSGTLNRATGRLEGTITTSDGVYHGLFAGAFFGPQAAEIGLAFSLVKDNGIGVAGYIGTNRK